MSQLNRDDDDFRNVEPDNIQAPPRYHEGRQQVVTGDTARQAPSGMRVLVVLAVSLAVALVIWGAGSAFHWW